MLPIFKVIFLAMLPIFELRGALPVAYFTYHYPLWQSYIIAVIGNAIPILPLVYFLRAISDYLSKVPFFKKFFDGGYRKTEKAFSGSYAKGGKLGLVIFVGIPLPMTGAWTGAVASTLFKIKPKEGFGLNFLGILIAGVIVSVVCLLFKNIAIKGFL